MLQASLIKILLQYDYYNKYRGYIKQNNGLSKEFNIILKLIDNLFYDKKVKTLTSDMVLGLFGASYPNMKTEIRDGVKKLLADSKKVKLEDGVANKILNELMKKYYAEKISEVCLDILNEPNKDILQIESFINEYKTNSNFIEDEDRNLVTNDIEKILDIESNNTGYDWFSELLTNALGKIKGGDLGIVVAVPNAGKTAFCLSIATALVKQGAVVTHINNEERGSKVMLRFIENYLDKDKLFIINNLKDIPKVKEEIKDKYYLYDLPITTINDIKMLLEKHKPQTLVIDVAHKIATAGKDRRDLELGEIFKNLRELAKTYNVHIIGTIQADAQAYTKKFLTLENISNSKISIQGEADYIIGIGIEQDDATKLDYRYISTPKNKLTGFNDTRIIMKLNNLTSKYIEI